jgi:DNA-binding transcriptional ArsR family regulator
MVMRVAKNSNLHVHLRSIDKALSIVNWKLNRLLAIHENPALRIETDIAEFPKHLQETLLALKKLGEATASDVATLTGKARAVESAYLNQLLRHGRVYRTRKGRRCFYALKGAE